MDPACQHLHRHLHLYVLCYVSCWSPCQWRGYLSPAWSACFRSRGSAVGRPRRRRTGSCQPEPAVKDACHHRDCHQARTAMGILPGGRSNFLVAGLYTWKSKAVLKDGDDSSRRHNVTTGKDDCWKWEKERRDEDFYRNRRID